MREEYGEDAGKKTQEERGGPNVQRSGCRDAGPLKTEEGKDGPPVAAHVAHNRGEVGLRGQCPDDQAQKADREIPEGRHILGSMAGADGGLVFSEGDVPAPVEGVLDPPVTAVPSQKVGRRGGGRRVARDPVDGFGAGFAGFKPGDGSRDPVGLEDVGEAKLGPDILREGGVEEADLPDLETAVFLVDRPVRLGVRGEKPRAGLPAGQGAFRSPDRRALREVRAGCP